MRVRLKLANGTRVLHFELSAVVLVAAPDDCWSI